MDYGEFKDLHNTSHPVHESIGMVVREYREQAGLNSMELSVDAHVDRKTLANIVEGKGDYKISSLIKVLTALEVDLDKFFYRVAVKLIPYKPARQESPTITVEDVSINQVKIEIITPKERFKNILA